MSATCAGIQKGVLQEEWQTGQVEDWNSVVVAVRTSPTDAEMTKQRQPPSLDKDVDWDMQAYLQCKHVGLCKEGCSSLAVNRQAVLSEC